MQKRRRNINTRTQHRFKRDGETLTPELNIPGSPSPVTVFALELPPSRLPCRLSCDDVHHRTPFVAAARRYSPSNSLRRGFLLSFPATMFATELPSSQFCNPCDGIRPRTPSVAAGATVFALELPPSWLPAQPSCDDVRPRTPFVTVLQSLRRYSPSNSLRRSGATVFALELPPSRPHAHSCCSPPFFNW